MNAIRPSPYIEFRIEVIGPLKSLLVEDRCCVTNPGLRYESFGDLVDTGHRWCPLGMSERADGNHLGARFANGIEQSKFVVD